MARQVKRTTFKPVKMWAVISPKGKIGPAWGMSYSRHRLATKIAQLSAFTIVPVLVQRVK